MSQSSEIAGGAGFTFEGSVAAAYLAALLAEDYAPGIADRIVCNVAVGQRDFGEPLDDLLVVFSDVCGDKAHLSLQVKRSITISRAVTNTDFREIIRDSWMTLAKADFRIGIDRFGVAVGEVAKDKLRALRLLCEYARESLDAAHFESRFAQGGNASSAVTAVKADVVALLVELHGGPCDAESIQRFLAHFVLIEFDFLHGGSISRPEAINQIRTALAKDHSDQAPLVWDALYRMARESAGAAGQFDRPRVVQTLAKVVRLRGAGSLRADLDQIGSLARSWIEDIKDDVGGFRLHRDALGTQLEECLATSRAVQVRGLPGSGKSVLLRRRIEAELVNGPVLFLKADRLEGKSWSSFARAIGLSSARLVDLLMEIGATGSSTLYIDGIDRVEREQQPIILDVVRTIVSSPLLREWHIIVSLRDSGIEPLRNWMRDLLDASGIRSVEVRALDDTEAHMLATAKPHLRDLLFGSKQVREIVRRPFFAQILDKNFSVTAGGMAFQPQSEVDLIDNWWTRGGYDADGQTATLRQRAIIAIGALRGRNLSEPIAVSRLTDPVVALIDDLVGDGIIQHVRPGHTVRFSHDIFFEWAYFHVLRPVDIHLRAMAAPAR